MVDEMAVIKLGSQLSLCRGFSDSSDLGHASVPKQLAAGGAAGWVSGYLTMKAGKMAATAIGGTLLLLQIAHHKGYIKVR